LTVELLIYEDFVIEEKNVRLRRPLSLNICLIVVDALRARNLGCYGYNKPTSPNIDELAKNGIKFENCFSTVNCTDPSLTTILTGKHPISHGVTKHGETNWNDNYESFVDGGSKLLHEILKEKGYSIFNFDIGVTGPWLREEFDEDKSTKAPLLKRIRTNAGRILEGSERVYKFFEKLHDRILGFPDPGIPADRLADQAIRKLDGKEGFFAFLHFWDVHIPYIAPKKYLELFGDYTDGDNQKRSKKISEISEEEKEENETKGRYMEYLTHTKKTLSDVWRDYDGAIRYVDEQIGRLKKELPNDTLFIITADHGENIGKDKPIYFSHAGLYDTTAHVPLVFNHKDLEQREINSLVSHIDLTPTILDILDVRNPNNSDGCSILPLIKAEKKKLHNAVYAEMGKSRERMIRTGRWKYIQILKEEDIKSRYWYNGDGEAELYNLKKDPEEENNIADDEPEVLEKLEQKLDNKARKFKEKFHTSESRKS